MTREKPIISLLNKFTAVTILSGILIYFVSLSFVRGQGNANVNSQLPWSSGVPQWRGNFGVTGSPAYREEISHLLFKEADQAAAELGLPDYLPVSVRNITRLVIFPPRLAKNMQGLGSVVTSNYIYSVSCGYKFSGITRVRLQQEDDQLKAKYVLPMSQMDTNAAFQLATHFLSLASMDVTALNRDCKVHITTSVCPDYEHFVPIYYISWVKRREQFGNVASVEVFLPDKSLRQLRVARSEYILSQPVKISDPEFLSLPTNAPPGQFRNFRPPSPQQFQP